MDPFETGDVVLIAFPYTDVARTLIEKRLGRLSEEDRGRVGQALRTFVDRMSVALET